MEFMHPDWGLFLIKYGHLTIITADQISIFLSFKQQNEPETKN